MRKLLLSMCMMPMLAFSQAVLPTLWDFSNPGISSPPNGWTTGLGTNGNLTYTGNQNSVGGDGIACRLDATGEFLTIWFADKPGPVSYWMRGTGITPANPSFTGTFSIQQSADGSSWTDMRTFTTAQPIPAAMTRYVDNPNAATRYLRFFYTEKLSGSNVALDSVMIRTPPPPGQGINVLQNSVQLVNGGNFAFGNSASKTFTLQNFGVSDNLSIDSVVLSGEHASDFTIGTYANLINPNSTGNLTVQFSASAQGSRLATLKIYSNDSERNPFSINLYAIGGNFATEPATQSAAVNISNVRPYAMNVSFSRAAAAEKYILLRKAGGPVNEVPVDGVTYKKGDYIGGSQVAYIGTDTALIRPTYILANTTYSFAAFAFNGPDGFENYKTDVITRQTTTTPAELIGNYYANVNAGTSNFIPALATRIRTPHDTVFYSNYAPVMVNNYLTRDTSDGKKVVNCVYTGTAYVYEDPFVWNGGGPGGILTREHTFAQSWMPSNGGPGSGWPEVNGKEVSEFNDLHHLFPAHQTLANAVRSNLPFGNVVNVNSTSPTGFGKRGTDSRGITVYEPKDDQKGNLARALFYMLVRYDGIRGNQWRLPTNQEISVLLQWHQQDPPDALEIARNEYIASVQKNRNPFIDYPQWVNRINFSNMTYIADPSMGSITVTAPATNATIIAGTTANISWTATNVDSVLIELQTASSGSFKEIGKYLATSGSISYLFNEAATNNAVIRISKTSDNSVNAVSGAFKIVQSAIDITAPTQDEEFDSYDNIVVKWTKSNVTSVSLKCYVTRGTALIDSLILPNPVTADSAVINVPKALAARYLVYIKEIDANKNDPFLAWDSVGFIVDVSIGLSKNQLNDKISVYPVPSNGLINVNINGAINLQTINVYDITGRLVETSATSTVTISTKGLYFLHVTTDKGTAVKKVIIE